MDAPAARSNGPASPAPDWRRGDDEPPSGLVARLLIFWRAVNVQQDEQLEPKNASKTLFRFFRSQHVVDLKLIAYLAVVLFLLYLFVNVVIALTTPLVNLCTEHDKYHDTSTIIGHGLDVLITRVIPQVGNFVSPAIPITGAVLAWTYLSAATRLGVVDLFACEISTLCRVGTIFDIGKRYVRDYEDGPAQEQHAGDPESKNESDSKFISEESYFPVFEQNSKDLEALEAVVVNHITEFYTYMKAARDLQRKLASIAPPPSESGKEITATTPADNWHKTLADLIYVLFLGYESARKSVNELIEFEPTCAENTIVILLTELVCFTFLCGYLKDKNDDLRLRRLRLRQDDYEKLVQPLVAAVQNRPNNDPVWAPAKETIPELVIRYDAARAAFIQIDQGLCKTAA
jgi:hypothetical protein